MFVKLYVYNYFHYTVIKAHGEECLDTVQCDTKRATCRSDNLGTTRCICADPGEVYDPSVDTCLTGDIVTVVLLSRSVSKRTISKTRLFKYIKKNYNQKKKIFRKKRHSDIFHISAQNIICGYSLEPPRRGGSIEYPQSMF